jgi:hypothetical protein
MRVLRCQTYGRVMKVKVLALRSDAARLQLRPIRTFSEGFE